MLLLKNAAARKRLKLSDWLSRSVSLMKKRAALLTKNIAAASIVRLLLIW